jgi:hypothetical protein
MLQYHMDIKELIKYAIREAILNICYVILILMGIQIMFNIFNINTDSTDKDGWNRSGLQLHIDHATGIEYLSTPSGGLIQRENNK